MNRREFLGRALAAVASFKIAELWNPAIDPYEGWSELERAIGCRADPNAVWAVNKVQSPLEYENDAVHQRSHEAFMKWAIEYNRLHAEKLELWAGGARFTNLTA